MSLECPNSSFGLVAMVHVRWDFLMFAFPYLGDCLDVCRTGFIVEDLQVSLELTVLKAFHDSVVGRDLVMVRFRLEGLHQNDICCIVIC